MQIPSVMQMKSSSLPNIPGLGGAIAGLVGGIAMAIAGAILSILSSNDVWLEAKQIAGLVYGQQVAARSGFVAGPVMVGTLIHFIVAIGLGALFGVMLGRVFRVPSTMGTPVLAGLIYGLAVWFITYYLVLPITNPLLLNMYAPVFIIQHIVYGLVTGIIYLQLHAVPYQDDLSYAD